ncbi:hypothetical protein D3C83_02320 [compost metagenome]
MPFFVRNQHFHPAGQHEIERVGFLAGTQNEGISGIAAMLHATQHLRELRVGKQGKQRYALQDLRIQRKLCRHVNPPRFLFYVAAPVGAVQNSP